VFVISKELTGRVINVHGEAGKQWLRNLPILLKEFCDRWSLTLEAPFENLSYNLVIPGTNSDGEKIVLKLGPPCAEFTTEAASLELFSGRAVVRLLEKDPSRGALLLERVLPGIPLHLVQDEASAILTAASLMKKLWRDPPVDHPFPLLPRWFRSLERLQELKTEHDFPGDLIERARTTFDSLQSPARPPLILHGDFHHENILYSSKDGWVAIDPKGVCGDPGYEIGTFMLNQIPTESSLTGLRDVLS
jgi:streptomycin 6-kinase